MRLRECLISFLGESTSDELVPAGKQRPKHADFRAWTELLANTLAAGASAAKLRSYLKKTAVETWEYVNWLTHAKNAVRMDAEIGLKVVEHLLGMFTAARLRIGRMNRRCAERGSYELVAETCRHCGWVDPSYESPDVQEWSEAERARRLATPCVPSSDISTFMGPHDFP